MGFGSFFSSLLKGNDADGSPPKNKGEIEARPSVTIPAPPEQNTMGRAEADAMLLHEEIMDSRGRLCGYRFSLKSLDEQVFSSEAQFFEALQVAGIQTFAQRRLALVPISPDGLIFGCHKSMQAENTVFLLDMRNSALSAESLLGRLSAIHGANCKTALRGMTLSDEEIPLLAETDIVFLGITDFSLQQFQKLAACRAYVLGMR